MESLDLLANNMANASAPGFKADREFFNTYMSDDSSGSVAMPLVEKRYTDFSQGSLASTGNPLDMAISGRGFFAVNSPSGALYTRSGSFRLSSQGELETQDGYKVRGQDGKSIRVDAGKQIEIAGDGTVRQDGIDVARLDVVDFKDVQQLNKRGQNYFQLAVNAPGPVPAANSELQQGKLEGANFQTAESAVRLVSVMRQFENLQRAMSVGADMNKKAVEDVARV